MTFIWSIAHKAVVNIFHFLKFVTYFIFINLLASLLVGLVFLHKSLTQIFIGPQEECFWYYLHELVVVKCSSHYIHRYWKYKEEHKEYVGSNHILLLSVSGSNCAFPWQIRLITTLNALTSFCTQWPNGGLSFHSNHILVNEPFNLHY